LLQPIEYFISEKLLHISAAAFFIIVAVRKYNLLTN